MASLLALSICAMTASPNPGIDPAHDAPSAATTISDAPIATDAPVATDAPTAPSAPVAISHPQPAAPAVVGADRPAPALAGAPASASTPKHVGKPAALSEPALPGSGLAWTTGIGAALTLAAGVTAGASRARARRHCDSYGGYDDYSSGYDYCYFDSSNWRLEEASIGIMVGTGLATLGVGIAAGIIKGRHDAWATHFEGRRTPNVRRLRLVGGGLMALGGVMGIVSTTLAITHWDGSRGLHAALPVMGAGTLASLGAGTGLLAYTVSYNRRSRAIERLSAQPIAAGGMYGLSLSGRF